MTNDATPQKSEDEIEISANLRGVSVRAGGGWKRYLGPWLGPIVLVLVLGGVAALIIFAMSFLQAGGKEGSGDAHVWNHSRGVWWWGDNRSAVARGNLESSRLV